jgi:hypothetical protein
LRKALSYLKSATSTGSWPWFVTAVLAVASIGLVSANAIDSEGALTEITVKNEFQLGKLIPDPYNFSTFYSSEYKNNSVWQDGDEPRYASLGFAFAPFTGCLPTGESSGPGSASCPLPEPLIPGPVIPQSLIQEPTELDERMWFNPNYYNVPGYRRDTATWGLGFTLNFTEMAQLQLGENIWDNLAVGSGNLNDLVIPDYGFESDRPGLGLRITATKNDLPIFVYLDSDNGGLGACKKITPDNESRINTSYPGSDINRCFALPAEYRCMDQGNCFFARLSAH